MIVVGFSRSMTCRALAVLNSLRVQSLARLGLLLAFTAQRLISHVDTMHLIQVDTAMSVVVGATSPNMSKKKWPHTEYCKYDRAESFRTLATQSCDWCGDALCGFCGYIVDGETACNECYKTISECTHDCTSNCRREGCNCDCGEYHKGIPAHSKRV